MFGPWRLSQAFIPMMKTNKYGRIVNVSSLGGSLHYTNYGRTPAYSISKAALNVLTRKLAVELVNTGILVNSVDPGWVATDMGGSWRTSTAGRSKRNSLGCSTTRRWSNWWLFLWSWASTLVDKKYPALIPHIRKRTNYTKGMSNTKTILIYVDIFS